MKIIKNKKLYSVMVIILLCTIVFLSYSNSESNAKGPFSLPELTYKYNALEPYIDAETMKIHHKKHHAAYIDNLNKALSKYPELSNKSIEYLLTNLEELPEDIKESVRNNGGGHYNHSLFWSIMGDNEESEPTGQLKEVILKSFNTFENFQEEFKIAATSRFGSGWVWLIKDTKGNLKIISTPNQDSPIMDSIIPILGLDVWEHAYYLKYQNKRGEYVDNWWKVVNWEEVEKRYTSLVP